MREDYKELETPIWDIVKKKKIKVKDLRLDAGVNDATYYGLAKGELSPTYEVGKRAGQIKVSAKRLSDYLHVPVEELFPLYFCPIQRHSELTDDQIADIVHATNASPSAEEIIKRLYAILPDRELEAVVCMVFDGLTIKQTGARLGVTGERARQIKNKALRRIYNNKHKIFDCFDKQGRIE